MTTDPDTAWVGPMPETYDRLLGPAIFTSPAGDLAVRAAQTGAQRVLELAAGTGILTAGLVEAMPEADVTATDLNPAMVEYGGERVARAHWQVADVMDLPFADEAFDLVVCQFGVMFFPDRVGAYREVRRVLGPDGTFLFNTWDVVEQSDVPHALAEALAEVFPEDAPDFLTRIPHGYTDVARIKADLFAAGLMPSKVSLDSYTGMPATPASVAEGFCLGTPLRFELQERGALPDLVPRITAAVARRLGDKPFEGGLGAYVVTARRPE